MHRIDIMIEDRMIRYRMYSSLLWGCDGVQASGGNGWGVENYFSWVFMVGCCQLSCQMGCQMGCQLVREGFDYVWGYWGNCYEMAPNFLQYCATCSSLPKCISISFSSSIFLSPSLNPSCNCTFIPSSPSLPFSPSSLLLLINLSISFLAQTNLAFSSRIKSFSTPVILLMYKQQARFLMKFFSKFSCLRLTRQFSFMEVFFCIRVRFFRDWVQRIGLQPRIQVNRVMHYARYSLCFLVVDTPVLPRLLKGTSRYSVTSYGYRQPTKKFSRRSQQLFFCTTCFRISLIWKMSLQYSSRKCRGMKAIPVRPKWQQFQFLLSLIWSMQEKDCVSASKTYDRPQNDANGPTSPQAACCQELKAFLRVSQEISKSSSMPKTTFSLAQLGTMYLKSRLFSTVCMKQTFFFQFLAFLSTPISSGVSSLFHTMQMLSQTSHQDSAQRRRQSLIILVLFERMQVVVRMANLWLQGEVLLWCRTGGTVLLQQRGGLGGKGGPQTHAQTDAGLEKDQGGFSFFHWGKGQLLYIQKRYNNCAILARFLSLWYTIIITPITNFDLCAYVMSILLLFLLVEYQLKHQSQKILEQKKDSIIIWFYIVKHLFYFI